jgi:hypothetical protein
LTASTTTHPSPKKQNTRPTLWRVAASKYVDLLLAGFIAWVVCFAFGWRSAWSSLAVFLWVAETLWCRDRLHPTAGEFCLGIRYLTSSSSQVVADIQVVHSKLRLNTFLVAGGVLELTLAVLFFSGWTFLGKAAALGMVLEPPLPMLYWGLMGLGFFTCGGLVLGGSRGALWSVPLLHLATALDLRWSHEAWRSILRSDGAVFGWVTRLPGWVVSWEATALLALVLTVGLLLSRKHLVN